MPYVCAPELAELNSGCHLPSLRLTQSALWRANLFASECCSIGILEPQSGMTYRHGQQQTGTEQISSPQDSPANPGLAQESAKAPQTTAGSGRALPNAFAWWDRDTCSWRMSQGSLLEELDTFSETWPRFGMMLRGECFPAPTWEPRNGGIASSSWPTATARDWKSGHCRKQLTNSRPLSETCLNWQAPTTNPTGGYYGGDRGGIKLSGQITQYGPLAQPTNGDPSRPSSGRLNPAFVEWLMGYPPGWSAPNAEPDLKPWVTACRLLLQQRLGSSSLRGYAVSE